MLKRAISENKGNLYDAVEALKAGKYFPIENIHYKKIVNKYDFARISFITHGKENLEPFSLETI
ncbi:hypothetical protein D3C86_2154660 [compost metagenome]